MHRLLSLILTIALTMLTSSTASEISIIPRPQKLATPAAGKPFVLQATCTISASSDDANKVAKQLANYLQPATGFQLEIVPADGDIQLILDSESQLADEAYIFAANEQGIVITAKTNAGLFYGVQTLRQLLPTEIFSANSMPNIIWEIPAVTIEDSPRFSWRGLHLDVSRHFSDAEYVKQFLDYMALHKLNKFHWHLTDDQGWRIEIKQYPKLTEISSQRKETLIGHQRSKPHKFDGKPYGGYYTQEEIKQVIAHAADLHITVIPEIEMPGHAVAALTGYPEFGCTGGPYEVWTRWGISSDVFCAGNDDTLQFVKNILDEVCALFPSTYIHIGGDECKKDKWKQCPKCQDRIQNKGLKDEHELQSWFINDIEKHLLQANKKLVGWEEIREGKLSKSATVMTWRGVGQHGLDAAKDGHDVIVAPQKFTYFDHYQAKNDEQTARKEPLAIGGHLTLDRVYSFDPIFPELAGTDKEKHILGGQAQLWREYIPTNEHLEYMAYPRACALAEALWLQADKKDYEQFSARLLPHLERLDQLDINYRKLD